MTESDSSPMPEDDSYPRLMVDVPIETRLTFTDKSEFTAEWVTSGTIAAALGVYPNWVYRMVAELELEPRLEEQAGKTVSFYPPYTTSLLKEELVWRETWQSLPSYLTANKLAELVGRSSGWTKKTIDEIGITPIQGKAPSGQLAELYPKGVLKTLRHINMAVPMDDGWYSIGQLLAHTGLRRDWVLHRLAEAGYTAERRRSSLNGHILPHFPADARDMLEREKTEHIAPGGSWLTQSAIVQITGRSHNWVSRRLKEYENQAQPRLDDRQAIRLHYSPGVVAALVSQSEAAAALPEVGDLLTIREVARALGHALVDKNVMCNELGIQPEMRRNKKGRVHEYYPRSVIEQLRDYEREHQEPNITQADFLQLTFAVGSIRAQIRARKRMLQALSGYGEQADQSQVAALHQQITNLKLERRKAEQQQYRASKRLAVN